MIFGRKSKDTKSAIVEATNPVFPLIKEDNVLLPELPAQRKEIIWQLHRDLIYRYESVRHRMTFDEYIEVGRTVSFLKLVHFLGFTGVFGSMDDEEFKEHCDTIRKVLNTINALYPELEK
jgi:hypothetical protein